DRGLALHMPATPAHLVDPCSAVEPDSETASHAAALAEALRKRKGSDVPREILDAQDSLERRIRAHLARGRVTVTLTDNRYTMISVRRVAKDRSYEVRLHAMFVDADPVITRALARYIADNDADASRVLGDFIDQNAGHVRGRARRQPMQMIFTAGEHHDLREIYDELNARYFANKIDAAITWGQRTGRPRRRNSIKMGSYSVEDRLIRIHRSLDRSFVPRFFVAWIVFHEMLHQVHDIRVKNGRREFHSKEFLADEAMYEHYDQAKSWERRHLDALLTY
ncbi:MAG TPA: hypothetical protein VLT45_29845, partial [Kofleriaceae bacterium]|nr:hypothetical protein [Kofleriaceae bacterium]